MCSRIIRDFRVKEKKKNGFFAKFGFKEVCPPRLKNQKPESAYQTGIILRKELGLFWVPHFVYHYHYLLQIASKNENSAKRCSHCSKICTEYRHSLISVVSISTIFDLLRFMTISYFPPLY